VAAARIDSVREACCARQAIRSGAPPCRAALALGRPARGVPVATVAALPRVRNLSPGRRCIVLRGMAADVVATSGSSKCEPSGAVSRTSASSTSSATSRSGESATVGIGDMTYGTKCRSAGCCRYSSVAVCRVRTVRSPDADTRSARTHVGVSRSRRQRLERRSSSSVTAGKGPTLCFVRSRTTVGSPQLYELDQLPTFRAPGRGTADRATSHRQGVSNPRGDDRRHLCYHSARTVAYTDAFVAPELVPARGGDIPGRRGISR